MKFIEKKEEEDSNNNKIKLGQCSYRISKHCVVSCVVS